MSKKSINIVWLKRDLRLEDNEAIANAIKANKPFLFIYVFEKSLIADPHYDERHWNFIKESLVELNAKLKKFNTKVLTITSEVIITFNQLLNYYQIDTVFSHQETGLLVTFNRDKDFARFCRNNNINWLENNNNGVLRGLLDRKDWVEKWEDFMNKPQLEYTFSNSYFLNVADISEIEKLFSVTDLTTNTSPKFQKGGTNLGWQYANSFFEKRHQNYSYHISKPEESRVSCSRLSPYIAWGNLSIRQVYQKALNSVNEKNKKQLIAFMSRLRWQAHFIQKFEMEHTMENASINKGYSKLKKSISEKYQEAWKKGETGFPIVDASMICLRETGYLNFRMRAMLVSFFTHILWQPWQACSQHLSQLFLDFEPGIHFPQLNMQAGETGINDLRIYNPTKNSLTHDENAKFIKKWIPQLAKLPVAFIHEPYLMTELDQQFNDFYLGKDYPKPVIDYKSARKKAAKILWDLRKNEKVLIENQRILKKHTLRDRNQLLSD